MRRYSEAVKADARRRMSPPHRQRVAQHYAAMQFKSTDSVTSDGDSLKRVRWRREGSCKICRIRSVVYEVN